MILIFILIMILLGFLFLVIFEICDMFLVMEIIGGGSLFFLCIRVSGIFIFNVSVEVKMKLLVLMYIIDEICD